MRGGFDPMKQDMKQDTKLDAKKEGYTAVPNGVLEKAYETIRGGELLVLLVVIRYTYGFSGREEAELSASFLAKATNISTRHVSNCLKSLEEKNVIQILKERGEHRANRIRVNDCPDSWSADEKKESSGMIHRSYDLQITDPQILGGTDLQIRGGTDLQILQENKNIKQETKQEYCSNFEKLWKEYPLKRGKSKVSKKTLRELDKIGYEKMHRALERYKATKPDWQHWQNGSTWFGGGYLDYLSESEEEETNGTTGTNGTTETTGIDTTASRAAAADRQAGDCWDDGLL